MKKILFATLLVFCATGIQAIATSSQVNSYTQSESQASAQTYYSGPAWSVGNDDVIPQGGSSIQVEWTSEGLWINGSSSTLTVNKIRKGTFMMRVNGRTKNCTHYITYQGERYYFAV